MHSLLLVTCNKEFAETSQEAREYVYETLINDESFVGEGGLFSSPIADCFVIGGRWSGELSRQTWAKEVQVLIEELEKKEGIHIWGAFYGNGEMAEKQKRLTEEVETFYKKSLPDEYKDKGLVYVRDTYEIEGYEDDAMIVTSQLYDLFLKPYKGLYEKCEDGLEYVDLEGDEVSHRFVQNKWLVVVDYHW